MILNTTLAEAVPKEDFKWFQKVSELFDLFGMVTSKQNLPNLPQRLQKVADTTFECHTIAVAVSMIYPEMKVKHGVYAGICKENGKSVLNTCTHSWNVTPSGTIIDAYPVGVITGGPIVVASHGLYKDFGAGLYTSRPMIIHGLPMFRIWTKACFMADLLGYAKEKFVDPVS